MRMLLPAMRIAFGGWMLVSGINHFAPIYPVPELGEPLAAQLIGALDHSGLMDVVKAIQLGTGALILAGAFVPLALALAMPLSVCALYVAAVIERDPLVALLALAVFALNGLLMLAHLHDYRGILATRALALGESGGDGGNYEATYARPLGGLGPFQVAGALVPLLGAAAFYQFVVPSLLGKFCLIALIVPAAVLLAKGAQGIARKG